jgi:DNA-binding CsgD family transcriptional regulator
MDEDSSAAIDIVEAAYDLEVAAAEWLPNILRVGAPLLDRGLGAYGTVAAGTSNDGVPMIAQMVTTPGAEEFAMNVMKAGQEVGPELVGRASTALRGKVYTLTEMAAALPVAYEAITRHTGCKDMLSATGVDPDGHGPHISVGSKDLILLDRRERTFWQMLEVHLASGHRLRRALKQAGDVEGTPLTELPLHGEALVDPKRFLVAHAVGDALRPEASVAIRRSAQLVDKARGPLRRSDPVEALELWKGLVRGKWTLVDWFDSDGRRFILAKPNAPRVIDPRGLTEREAQVATYAAAGDSNKMIGYRLGLSSSYVSRLLNGAMRKLGVKTHAQLVEKLGSVQQALPAA